MPHNTCSNCEASWPPVQPRTWRHFRALRKICVLGPPQRNDPCLRRQDLTHGWLSVKNKIRVLMPSISNLRVVTAATRLAHVRYAIRDMAVLAEQLAREGKTILPLNIGDPLNFDFCTPP